jgi:elongation factor Ts
MANIKAADVAKLRKATGAGMMDCKNALVESDGDFDKAIDIIRKKGQLIANKRADREASEGVVLAKVNAEQTTGAIVVLNCETDFVAKNADFISLTQKILDAAIENNANNLDEVKNLTLDGRTIGEQVLEQNGIIGEKIKLSHFDKIEAPQVVAYIHPGNKLATIVGFNEKLNDTEVGKYVAMQVASMAPVAVDEDNVPQSVIDHELEIGKDQARQAGKPEAMLEKIAMGKLGKFFKENTLLNQAFVKDNKKNIREYLKEHSDNLTVTGFKRFTLNV